MKKRLRGINLEGEGRGKEYLARYVEDKDYGYVWITVDNQATPHILNQLRAPVITGDNIDMMI